MIPGAITNEFEWIYAEFSQRINFQRICNKDWQIKFQNSGRNFCKRITEITCTNENEQNRFHKGLNTYLSALSHRRSLSLAPLVCIDVKAMFSGIFRFKSNFVWSILFLWRTHTSNSLKWISVCCCWCSHTVYTWLFFLYILHSFCCVLLLPIFFQHHDFMVILRFMAHSIAFTTHANHIFFLNKANKQTQEKEKHGIVKR